MPPARPSAPRPDRGDGVHLEGARGRFRRRGSRASPRLPGNGRSSSDSGCHQGARGGYSPVGDTVLPHHDARGVRLLLPRNPTLRLLLEHTADQLRPRACTRGRLVSRRCSQVTEGARVARARTRRRRGAQRMLQGRLAWRALESKREAEGVRLRVLGGRVGNGEGGLVTSPRPR